MHQCRIFQADAKHSLGYFQLVGSLGNISFRANQCLADKLLFNRFNRVGQTSGSFCIGRIGSQQRWRQIITVHHIVFAQNTSPFDAILQLANISRPPCLPTNKYLAFYSNFLQYFQDRNPFANEQPQQQTL